MEPDSDQRLNIALDELLALNGSGAERYLRDLHATDPGVAARVDRLLRLRQEPHAEPTDESRNHKLSPPLGHASLNVSGPGGALTISAEGRGTLSFPQPDPVFFVGAGRSEAVAPGQFLGRYRLVRAVGRGAFGEVWQAFDPVLQKFVAVKVQLPRASGRELPRDTFLREARKAAALRHPALVQVHDVIESASGWYIVSEFVEGESLRTCAETERLPFVRAARIVAAVAGALGAAHLAGLVHRDVKPANILLDRAGNAYLTDFGLAVREDELFAERSRVAGTLAYMSPEQIRGDTHLLDGRADIYALGAVLYELLTGRPLFRAESIAEYRELILRREPRPPRTIDPEIPEPLERACLKCLAKEVRERYRTARDLAADLESWLADATQTVSTSRAINERAANEWLRPAVFGAGIVLLLGSLIGSAVYTGSGRSQTGASVEPVPKVPAVKELVWPVGRAECKWEVLPANRLKTSTEAVGLLQLGEGKGDSWEFCATFRQLNNVGWIGLFLGHRLNPDTGKVDFELIQIVVDRDNKITLNRSIESYRFDPQLPTVHGKTLESVSVPSLEEENKLRLRVRNNRLAEVWFNDVEYKALGGAVPELQLPADAPFGVYNRRSEGLFSNLTLNGTPIPLLVDAKPRVPEGP
ncbi:serine threonine protein kinase : Adenylate/guanylate cyclase (Fragment) OS=Rhodopirellula maiorica SM1 GN=RMSM_07014 PE=4 SV=1: Pkinase [Gemmata massiliana]|uniref:Protein kinase domain-containing protein n=1 Tax=Gemmata massiliana TaxID=1210884 RepID=A0A6P2D2W4_9BACT